LGAGLRHQNDQLAIGVHQPTWRGRIRAGYLTDWCSVEQHILHGLRVVYVNVECPGAGAVRIITALPRAESEDPVAGCLGTGEARHRVHSVRVVPTVSRIFVERE